MAGRSWTSNAGRDLIGRELGAFFRDSYLAGRPAPRLTTSDLQGAPPLLLQAGEAEMPLSDSVELVRQARAAGVRAELEVYAAMLHNFIKFPRPTGDLAIRRMAAWARSH